MPMLVRGMRIKVVAADTETEDDSVRIIAALKPPGGGDNIEQYNDKNINAKKEKFKMGLQGSTSTII